jgi:hypothetical protein
MSPFTALGAGELTGAFGVGAGFATAWGKLPEAPHPVIASKSNTPTICNTGTKAEQGPDWFVHSRYAELTVVDIT